MSYEKSYDMSQSNPVGLENSKGENCCYINVIIHTLFYFKELRHSILSLKVNGTSKGCLLLLELKNIIQSYYNRYTNSATSSYPLESYQFRSILANYCLNSSSHPKKFRLNRQDDPIEFLMFILDALHTHHIKPNKSIEPDDDDCTFNTCASHDLFFLELIEKCCNSCKIQTIFKYSNNYFIYEIYPVEVINLIENDHLNTSEIKGNLLALRKKSQAVKKCDQCLSDKKLLCLKSSKYLLINLVTADKTNTRKIIKYLYLMISLNISNKNLFDFIDDSQEKMYNLIGVVLYYNNHYLCAFADKGKWYLFDDDLIKSYENWEELANRLLKNLYLPVALYYKEKHISTGVQNHNSLKVNDYSNNKSEMNYKSPQANEDKGSDRNNSMRTKEKPVSILKVKSDRFSTNDTLNNEGQFISRQMSREPDDNHKSSLAKFNQSSIDKSLKSFSSNSQEMINDTKKSKHNHIFFDVPVSSSKKDKENKGIMTLKQHGDFNSPNFYNDTSKLSRHELENHNDNEEHTYTVKTWVCNKCHEDNKDDVYSCKNCSKINFEIRKRIYVNKEEEEKKAKVQEEEEEDDDNEEDNLSTQILIINNSPNKKKEPVHLQPNTHKLKNTIQLQHNSLTKRNAEKTEEKDDVEMEAMNAIIKTIQLDTPTQSPLINRQYQVLPSLPLSIVPDKPTEKTNNNNNTISQDNSQTDSSNSKRYKSTVRERRLLRQINSTMNSNNTIYSTESKIQSREEKQSLSHKCQRCDNTSFYNSICTQCGANYNQTSFNSIIYSPQKKENNFYVPYRPKISNN